MLNGLNKKQLAISAGIIFAALAIGGGIYWQLAKTQESAPIPSMKPNEEPEISSIVSSIKQLVDIPSDETPTVATVTDQEKVRSQPFFASAQTGDKIVVFSGAKKAVLFRPSSGKIINIASLTQEQTGEASASTQESQAIIAIRNGTSKTGLAGLFESKIKEIAPLSQTRTENAVKNNYSASMVVLLNEQKRQLAEIVGEKLGISLSDKLPEEEKSLKQEDMIVILGSDKIE